MVKEILELVVRDFPVSEYMQIFWGVSIFAVVVLTVLMVICYTQRTRLEDDAGLSIFDN